MDKMSGPLDLGLKKLRSVREKSNGHGHGKSVESNPKVGRTPTPLLVVLADEVLTFSQTRDLLSIFKPESVRLAQKEREEAEREAAKVLFPLLAQCRPNNFFSDKSPTDSRNQKALARRRRPRRSCPNCPQFQVRRRRCRQSRGAHDSPKDLARRPNRALQSQGADGGRGE